MTEFHLASASIPAREMIACHSRLGRPKVGPVVPAMSFAESVAWPKGRRGGDVSGMRGTQKENTKTAIRDRPRRQEFFRKETAKTETRLRLEQLLQRPIDPPGHLGAPVDPQLCLVLCLVERPGPKRRQT